MSTKKEATKPTSFRITPETVDKLKEIGKQIGGTQDDLMEQLIIAYELHNAANVITERKMEIEAFRNKVNELVSSYTFSLQLCADAEERANSKVSQLIQSKDQTIIELQEKIKNLEFDCQMHLELRNKAVEEKAQIEKELEFLKTQFLMQQQYLEAFKKLAQENESLKNKDVTTN